jgi:hypothetical protein
VCSPNKIGIFNPPAKQPAPPGYQYVQDIHNDPYGKPKLVPIPGYAAEQAATYIPKSPGSKPQPNASQLEFADAVTNLQSRGITSTLRIPLIKPKEDTSSGGIV